MYYQINTLNPDPLVADLYSNTVDLVVDVFNAYTTANLIGWQEFFSSFLTN